MPKLLHLHTAKLAAILICANGMLLLYLSTGSWKPLHVWSWADIIGEGGAGTLAFVWLCLILKSRPSGRITNLLTVGLGLMFLAWWADALDEVIGLPQSVQWDHWLESGCISVGMLTLTYGLFHWHHEQLAIAAQRQKQERALREHRYFDRVTPLSGAHYLRQQINLLLKQETELPTALVIVDLDDFDSVNRRYSHQEGDHLLRAVSQLMLLNLRNQDLLCRLAGDRFVVLLPNTGEYQANLIAQEIDCAISHFAYRTQSHGERLYLRATTAVVRAQDEPCDALLQRLHLALAKAKNPIALRA